MTRLRTVVILYSAIWIAACAGAITMVWNDSQKLDIELGDWNFQALVVSDSAGQWVSTVIFGALILIGLLTLLLALRPINPAARGSLRLKQATGGEVEVTAENLELLLATELSQLPEVYDAGATVRLKGNAIATQLDLRIVGDVSIAAVTHAASQRLTEVFRDQVGVTDIKRPLIRVEYEGEPLPSNIPGFIGTPPPPPQPPNPEPQTESADSPRPYNDDESPLPPPPSGDDHDD